MTSSNWESLPWPALDRLFSFLRSDTCSDLADLARVSTHFRSAVMKFMATPKNRPTLRKASLIKSNNGLMIRMLLFSANLPFHGLSKLDWTRFHRSWFQNIQQLEVALKGPEDPVIEQVVGLLSTTIRKAEIYEGDEEEEEDGEDDIAVSSQDLSMCAQLLRSSRIIDLCIGDPILDDISAPAIISISSHAERIHILLGEEVELTEPASFIAQLDSLPAVMVRLEDWGRDLFFGLPTVFWKNFLNEKLTSNAIHYVEAGYEQVEKFKKAPIDLPETHIKRLHWSKEKAN